MSFLRYSLLHFKLSLHFSVNHLSVLPKLELFFTLIVSFPSSCNKVIDLHFLLFFFRLPLRGYKTRQKQWSILNLTPFSITVSRALIYVSLVIGVQVIAVNTARWSNEHRMLAVETFFSIQLLEMKNQQPNFLNRLLVTVKAHFHLNGFVNKHNFR